MAFNEVDRAQVLAEALPYIQKYSGKTIVVKSGGNAMISEDLRRAVISDIVLLNLVGIRVVVVHGGGPEINEMLTKVGKESKFVDGLLRDPKDDSTLISELQLSSVPALVREGVISGGMIPKVDCCVEAVRSGVDSAIILDGRVAHSILIELLSDAGIGTMLVH